MKGHTKDFSDPMTVHHKKSSRNVAAWKATKPTEDEEARDGEDKDKEDEDIEDKAEDEDEGENEVDEDCDDPDLQYFTVPGWFHMDSMDSIWTNFQTLLKWLK